MRMDVENVTHTDNLRKKLAVAVRSVQWSYAIFWVFSTTQQGVLEWGEGYYNGDIKTRKTVQAKDSDAQSLGLQRSEQLRKLYLSLLDGEPEQGAKKPSGALSPDDLSNLEWYYLVCMSYTFKFGQSLPGGAMATGQHMWLFDAQSADSRLFSRSLLAKSASLQTVICFPHMGGVIELGTTDLVPEDLNLIQHIKTTLMEVQKPICSEKHSYASYHDADFDDYNTDTKATAEIGPEILETIPISGLYPSVEDMNYDSGKHNDSSHNVLEETPIASLDDCSNDQHWHLMEDNISQPLQDSTTFGKCLFQDFGSCQETTDVPTCGENIEIPHSESVSGCRSSFLRWSKDLIVHDFRTRASSQETLKTILIKVPLIHSYSTSENLEKRGSGATVYPWKPQAFRAVDQSSMLPSATKRAEACNLMDTMEYLNELQARVDELESCIDFEGSSAMRDLDLLEHTSDNYNIMVEDEKQRLVKKRKASEMYETGMDLGRDIWTLDVKVEIAEDEVIVRMNCPWREHLLLDIMEVANKLNLDTHTVQSSTFNGILSLFLKSKIQRTAFASEGMIKQALGRTIGICG